VLLNHKCSATDQSKVRLHSRLTNIASSDEVSDTTGDAQSRTARYQNPFILIFDTTLLKIHKNTRGCWLLLPLHGINTGYNCYIYILMLRWKKTSYCIALLFVLAYCKPLKLEAQNGTGIYDTIRVDACIEANGDTIPCSWLDPVYVKGKLTGKWKKNYAEWTRLRNAVYVTYPYAIEASKVMNQINAQLQGITDKSKRKAIIKSREKELKTKFADKLTQLSVYQGKVLMKLIYRQTGNNCYEIIQEYKGSFNASFWQTIALIFGSNLRQNYDPNGKDQAMESIVQDVERMYGVR